MSGYFDAALKSADEAVSMAMEVMGSTPNLGAEKLTIEKDIIGFSKLIHPGLAASFGLTDDYKIGDCAITALISGDPLVGLIIVGSDDQPVKSLRNIIQDLYSILDRFLATRDGREYITMTQFLDVINKELFKKNIQYTYLSIQSASTRPPRGISTKGGWSSAPPGLFAHSVIETDQGSMISKINELLQIHMYPGEKTILSWVRKDRSGHFAAIEKSDDGAQITIFDRSRLPYQEAGENIQTYFRGDLSNITQISLLKKIEGTAETGPVIISIGGKKHRKHRLKKNKIKKKSRRKSRKRNKKTKKKRN